jgi:hypothetical protein
MSNSQLQEYVLALGVIQGHHTGENPAPMVLDVLEDCGFTQYLGSSQMDNTLTNDTIMAVLSSSVFYTED